ncbi:MAG: hypothetical protein K2K74_17260 [Lachnospiraceae bacterium]|nr:hypothetical protein [Lachnospiraceae bacterium]
MDSLYGIEMPPEIMQPIGERKELIFEHADVLGYERAGENGLVPDKETGIVYQSLKPLIDPETGEQRLPENIPMGGFSKEKLTKMFHSIGKPYIEGAFMNLARFHHAMGK